MELIDKVPVKLKNPTNADKVSVLFTKILLLMTKSDKIPGTSYPTAPATPDAEINREDVPEYLTSVSKTQLPVVTGESPCASSGHVVAPSAPSNGTESLVAGMVPTTLATLTTPGTETADTVTPGIETLAMLDALGYANLAILEA